MKDFFFKNIQYFIQILDLYVCMNKNFIFILSLTEKLK